MKMDRDMNGPWEWDGVSVILQRDVREESLVKRTTVSCFFLADTECGAMQLVNIIVTANA